ncbi:MULTISPECIES: GH1 family beta-glucosidase [unclassified Streptomyces]|uniref:GH1 family beta-glucosidase n=1 Tax=unclassified Streptomyces TaxID=2593676 RepID=UPI000370168A|nr:MULTISPECIES: GH1 family beta-glucosidase [unclassified Streptomyces]MYQ81713.1 beta-glucosidase [Streptomyces sp. SID4923]
MSIDLKPADSGRPEHPPLPSLALPGLPADFLWGAATSAYQIEGAVDADGRTPSIWDTFSHTPGAIEGDDHGDVACDHYHRMPDDVQLLADLGLDAYRFSLSWPRVQPGGRGPANAKGLDFYDRLVDELLAKGITPWATLYHWDLPQELEDAGGWPERETAYRFADYAELAAGRLGDRVHHWITLNEPFCSAILGYHIGCHAPGRKDFQAAISAVHHLHLGHGLAVQRIRSVVPTPAQVGITFNPAQIYPASDRPADLEAARQADGMGVRIYLDPVLRGQYPQDVVEDLDRLGATLPVEAGDLEVIGRPVDFLGINYYVSDVVAAGDEPGQTVRVPQHDRPVTAMPWEIHPQGMADLLTRISRDYPGTPVYITENGAAFDDSVYDSGAGGRIEDIDRTAYLADHLAAVGRAREAGADVRGFFAWSLMDNFEWAYGYGKRFGIVHVDYETQVRTPKQSAEWLRDAANATRGRQGS